MLELFGMILVPVCAIAIGFVFLLVANKHDEYVQKRGCAEFHRLYPNAVCPHDCSFWAVKAVEATRRNKIKEKNNGKNS